MSKALWWLIAGAAVLWLVFKDEPPRRPLQGFTETPHAPHYPIGSNSGPSAVGGAPQDVEPRALFGAGNFGVQQSPIYSGSDVDRAKREFEDAADDLRRSVRGLQTNDWDSQMGAIGRRLRGADDALSDLERMRPGDSSVMEARDNLDRMRRDIRRLHDENWREVVPNLYRRSALIQDDAARISTEPE
jgi:hypothetical protein